MPTLAENLLEEQLRFFLDELSGEALAEHLRIEANAYCDLLETVSVIDLISSDQIIAFVQRNILGYNPTEALREQSVMLFELALNNPDHQQQPLRQLINRQIYDLMVKRIVDRPDLRREIISSALQTPHLDKLLTNIVVDTLTDIARAKADTLSVPARLQPAILAAQKALRVLSLRVEPSIKALIRKAVQRSLISSEELICEALSNQQINALADALWPRLEHYQLGQATRHLELQGLSYLVVLYWNQIRQTEYMRQQMSLLINAWYEHAGHIPAMNILQSFGIEREHIAREAVALGQPLFNAWMRSGHIESRLREHLQRFYSADSTQATINAALNEVKS